MTYAGNFLDLICPGCGKGDRLNILATVWVRLTEDGSDAAAPDNGNHEWDDSSRFECRHCGRPGTVGQLIEKAG